jgi:peptide/nickel transport system permease protein
MTLSTESATLEETDAPARPSGSLRALLAALFEDRLAVFGFALVLLTAFAALAAPWIAPQNPYDLASLDVLDGGLAPGAESLSGKT